MENTYNILCRGVNGAGETNITDLLNLLQGAVSGDLVFVATPATMTSADTAADTTPGVAPDTDTLTVAQATILGYTISAKTSVETFR